MIHLLADSVTSNTTGETATTLGGLAALILLIFVKDYIRDRFSRPLERSKVSNLSEQTLILSKINDTLQSNHKFGKKQAKRIRKRLDNIHNDVVIVKEQTKQKE